MCLLQLPAPPLWVTADSALLQVATLAPCPAACCPRGPPAACPGRWRSTWPPAPPGQLHPGTLHGWQQRWRSSLLLCCLVQPRSGEVWPAAGACRQPLWPQLPAYAQLAGAAAPLGTTPPSLAPGNVEMGWCRGCPVWHFLQQHLAAAACNDSTMNLPSSAARCSTPNPSERHTCPSCSVHLPDHLFWRPVQWHTIGAVVLGFGQPAFGPHAQAGPAGG
jgi:hypothetical protein